MNRLLLQDKVCIITGASRGIGEATAKVFQAEGGTLVLVARNAERLEALKVRLGQYRNRTLYFCGDVQDSDFARNVVTKTVETYGKIDVLVNNAGITNRVPFSGMSIEDWDSIIKTNLYGTMLFSKSVLKYMTAGGTIVNVSSAAAVQPNLNHSHAYGASKAGILALTRSLALLYAPQGIRINAVCPGPIETDMTSDWTEDYRKKKMDSIPLKRMGKPEEVANAILFLASDLSSYICGAVLHVNGGTFMG